MDKILESDLSLSEVAKITGLSNDLIRLYEKEFDLEIPRTKEVGGHRRYSKEHVDEILKIKKMIQEQKLSYKDIKNIRAGLLPTSETAATLATPSVNEMREYIEQNEQRTQRLEQQMADLLILNKEIISKMDKQQQYIEGALQNRDQALMLEIRTRLEEKQQEKKSLLKRIFGSK